MNKWWEWMLWWRRPSYSATLVLTEQEVVNIYSLMRSVR